MKKHETIKTDVIGKVGVITLDSPPDNPLGVKMITEILDVMDKWENDNAVVTIMFKSALPDFSYGGDGTDLNNEMDTATDAASRTYTEYGRALTDRIASYPKSTLVAAKGILRGGTTVLFNACDIRIVGEQLRLKDSDMYYGLMASWGMSSLRLPVWIGRNKIMDYMFLAEELTGRQAYEMGLASKVVPDDCLNEVAFAIATKMSKAAPIAVKYFKQSVYNVIYHPDFDKARDFEMEAADIVYKTEDAKKGLENACKGIFLMDCFEGK